MKQRINIINGIVSTPLHIWSPLPRPTNLPYNLEIKALFVLALHMFENDSDIRDALIFCLFLYIG